MMNASEEAEFFARMNFVDYDVLSSPREKIRRKANLLKAVALESLNKAEVILTVEDQHSCKKIRSRIVATGDDQVVLEKGFSLPIHCIHYVEFP
jgi:hypothetical protein